MPAAERGALEWQALHQFEKASHMLSIIGTIVVGFIVGLLARAIKPGDDRLGLIMTTLLGIAGAFVARYVGAALGWYQPDEPAGWIASVIGAIVLLVIYGLVKGGSRRGR
jgi:uncharacterized membrane protein YeaQ/YmgE (transglycosylase-associated protein family)